MEVVLYLNTGHASWFIDTYSKMVASRLNLLYLPKKYVQRCVYKSEFTPHSQHMEHKNLTSASKDK